jgi:hypothetical protein
VAGSWRGLHNELHDLHSRRMRLAGHVARTGKLKNASSNFWEGNLKGKDHSEDLYVVWRIILELILWK